MQNNHIIKNSKVLITGGAGFIGSNILGKLLEQDNFIVCLDNFSTGRPENVSSYTNHPNFKLIEGDIREINDCRSACENIDYVLHQAALGSVQRSINNPKDSTDVNIGGFVNMLIAARDAKVKRFVYAASSSTYGDSDKLPKVEHVIGKPLSPYAVTKYVNELYARIFYQLYGLETVGLRYFNVFGPKQDPNGAYAAVIPRFILALLNKQQPEIYGDGKTSRDFTYIENIIYANQLAVTCEIDDFSDAVFNVACGREISLNELYKMIKGYILVTNPDVKDIEVKYGQERIGDIKHSMASIEKINDKLGYKPLVDTETGLQRTIEWFMNSVK